VNAIMPAERLSGIADWVFVPTQQIKRVPDAAMAVRRRIIE